MGLNVDVTAIVKSVYTATVGVATESRESPANTPGKVTYKTGGDGSGNYVATKEWDDEIDLTASTPDELDLTALASTGLSDTTFAKIKGYCFEVVSGTVAVGGAASNAWVVGGLASDTVITIPAGGRRMADNPLAAGWVVDSTHKSLKLDPGGSDATIRVWFWGE